MMISIPARLFAAAVGGAIIAAATLAFARTAHAESVYKCGGADGAVTFQQQPCAGARTQSIVEIAPAPPASASPDYGVPSDAHQDRMRASLPARGRTRASRETLSYECRAANGEVFYRHGGCPRQITGESNGSRGRSGHAATYAVSAEALPRDEACRRIAGAGSIGRSGHERDETVSTYDRNLGRDPCRYF